MSHSQQKERQLRMISDNGKVYGISHNVYQHLKNAYRQGPLLQVRTLGIKEASTFPGFCREHDRTVFQSIEVQDLNRNCAEQAALFFLRSVAYEYSSKRETAILFKGLQREVPPVAPEWEQIIAECALGDDAYIQRESPYYMCQLFGMLSSACYDSLVTHWTVLDEVLPISTCTVLCPWMEDYNANYRCDYPQPVVSVTVAPAINETHIIVSWLAAHESDASWIRQMLATKSGLEQFLNLCIGESTDFYFSIRMWDRLSKELRDAAMTNMLPNSHRPQVREYPRIVVLG